MTTSIKEFSQPRGAKRPTQDLAEFIIILRRGFNFSAANTSEWSFEDWELAVDAMDDEEGCGVAPPVGPDVRDPNAVPERESPFEGHGIWTLLAPASFRARGAFRGG